MMECEEPSFLLGADVVWVDTPDEQQSADVDPDNTFTIGQLAEKFGTTQRALRFYESRGLIKPERLGRQRVYSRRDCERLALIIKGRKLGFTLTEIGEMIAAEEGTLSDQKLRLTRKKCLEQLNLLYRQMSEIGEALAELRRIYVILSHKDGDQGGSAPN